MVIIVGSGLSGLLIGYRLKTEGIPFKILEARDRIGGRILTKSSKNDTPVEMGATWFGNQHTNFISLLDELGIPYFEQYMNGTTFFQPFSTSPASAIPVPSQPPSYRLTDGTSSIIKTLAALVGDNHILLNEQVKEIEFNKDSVKVKTDKEYHASQVVLALPPKLWASQINISPSILSDLKKIASATHTWMEDSIKIALTYQQPFWRMNEQSGALFSNSGPITEFYDHCSADETKYALCGFAHPSFGSLAFEERRDLIVKQVVNVFGQEGKEFIDYNEVIWSQERYTYTQSEIPLYPHQNNGHSIFRTSYFDDRLFLSSTEIAEVYPGYMEGAVVTANFVFDQLKATI